MARAENFLPLIPCSSVAIGKQPNVMQSAPRKAAPARRKSIKSILAVGNPKTAKTRHEMGRPQNPARTQKGRKQAKTSSNTPAHRGPSLQSGGKYSTQQQSGRQTTTLQNRFILNRQKSTFQPTVAIKSPGMRHTLVHPETQATRSPSIEPKHM